MILRRFMIHLKEQNWIAVALDVLVVITGIFLGSQVNTWNEARKSTDDANYYLVELNSYLIQEISDISSEEMTTSKETLSDVQRATELLFLDAWDKSEREEFSLKHRSVYSVHGERIKPPALVALYDNGKMEHINSRKVQSAVQFINDAYHNFNGHTDILRDVQLQAQNDVVVSIDYGLDDYMMEIAMKDEELLNNKGLKRALRLTTLTETVQINAITEFSEQLVQHQATIQSYINEHVRG